MISRLIDALAKSTPHGRAARSAWLDLSTELHMAEAYLDTLQVHLREHGCVHDFAEVANDGGRTAGAAEQDASPSGSRGDSPDSLSCSDDPYYSDDL